MRRNALVRLVCVGLAVAALPAAARAQLPHVGTATSTTTSMVVTPEGLLHFETSLVGEGTVLGRFTGTAVYDVNPLTGVFTGTLTKGNAAGSLTEAFIGQFNATFTGSAGHLWITGGTGRFKGAGGGGVFVGEVTSATTVDLDYLGVLLLGSGGPRR